MASIEQTDQSDIEDVLNDLVMNCSELDELEAHLAKFNIFRALKVDQYEIRHSNMLAWLLDPSENHSMGQYFLRRWIMEVMYRASQTDIAKSLYVSPITVDAMEFTDVQIYRERFNIDVLIVFETKQGVQWVVCVENKIGSKQGKTQLQSYRETIESHFPSTSKKLYFFLTKNDEDPADPHYIPVSYETVAVVLDRCISERGDLVGPEPRLLIDHYRQLLRDDFMDDNLPTQLAREIYKRHSKAIDFIIESKRDPIFELTNLLESTLKKDAGELGIKLSKTGKGRIRFLPIEWDTEINSQGKAWGDGGHYLVLELDLYLKQVELSMLAGQAPDEWTDKLWEYCDHQPLQKSQRKKPVSWLKAYRTKSNCVVKDDADPEALAAEILSWLRSEMKSPKFKNASEILRQHLLTMQGD